MFSIDNFTLVPILNAHQTVNQEAYYLYHKGALLGCM